MSLITRRRNPRHPIVVGVVALAFVASLSACRVAPSTVTVSTVLGGLNRPWDLGFLPDGSIVFTERSGAIKVIVGGEGGEVRQLAAPTDVVLAGEGGMLGLAIDPDFASNRHLYTCFSSNVSGARDNRVVRWTVDTGLTTLTDRTDIVTGMPYKTTDWQEGRHSGCRPRFGPDGYLYVGTGDAATGWTPQDPTSLGGKVLRVDRAGAPAPTNPGVIDITSPLDDRIYTYGHRNVQGIAVRADGSVFSVEHGSNCDDEVNLLSPGANFGWDPIVEGSATGYDESRPMTDLTRHPDAVLPVWASGCPTIAPSGATFVKGTQWAGWTDSIVLAVLKGQKLQVMFLDPAQANKPAAGHIWTTLTDQGRLRSAVQGPDGNLYVVTDAASPNGRILKVVPTP